jgi:hypothetical protein
MLTIGGPGSILQREKRQNGGTMAFNITLKLSTLQKSAKMIPTRFGLLSLALVIGAGFASATPITFVVSADGSGTIGATSFTNALITFTQVTNTTLLTSCGYPCAPDVTGNTVTISGVGTETLTVATYFFDNAINLFGITNTSGAAFLAAEDPALTPYNMQTAFGPTTYSIFTGSAVSSQPTSGGSLSVTFSGNDTVTAQACFGACSSSVPEPGSLGLALLGALPLVAGLLWSRKN